MDQDDHDVWMREMTTKKRTKLEKRIEKTRKAAARHSRVTVLTGKAADAAHPGATTYIHADDPSDGPQMLFKSAKPTGPDPGVLADALTVLADLPALDGRPDRDTVAARAAVTIATSPMAASALVKSLSGEAADLLGKAAELARMPASERATRRSVLAAMAADARGPERSSLGRMLTEHDVMTSALTPTVMPLAKVAGPKPDPDALTKAAAQAAADIRIRLDQALDAARERQGGPRR